MKRGLQRKYFFNQQFNTLGFCIAKLIEGLYMYIERYIVDMIGEYYNNKRVGRFIFF